jgi:hypothetical protein
MTVDSIAVTIPSDVRGFVPNVAVNLAHLDASNCHQNAGVA